MWDYDIEGYYIKSYEKVKINTLRRWINANIRNEKKQYSKEDNIIIKALHNSIK